MSRDLYVTPRLVTRIEDCDFYHTMELPGYGLVRAQWDLRANLSNYLGNVEFKGKRVLEIGTADGFLSFYMEKQGAEVVSYDLSERNVWDVVPYSRYDFKRTVALRQTHIQRLNNAYWFCHRLFNSNAKVVYGTVYEIPQEIGMVDISTFGAVLLHVRDPFLALQRALELTKEIVIITEPLWRWDWRYRLARKITLRVLGAYVVFVPDFRTCLPSEMWWILSPEAIIKFIGVLGFENVKVIYHHQQYEPHGDRKLVPFYTIVGRRTQ